MADPQIDKLWQEIRKLKREINKKAPASSQIDALTQGTYGLRQKVVPRVEGVTLSQTVGGLQVVWTPPLISDLKRYEIQVSAKSNFDPITASKNSTVAVIFFDEITSGTYYVRVRAVNGLEKKGDWSVTVSTATGTAATLDIDDDATSLLAQATKTGDWPVSNITDASGSVEAFYLPFQISTAAGTTDVEIGATVSFYLTYETRDIVRTTLTLDGVSYQEVEYEKNTDEAFFTSTQTIQKVISGVSTGYHEVGVSFFIEDHSFGPDSELQPDEINIQVFENLR